MIVYLFESTSPWSKDWNRSIWIVADNNNEARELAAKYDFDWSTMERFYLKV